MKFLKKINLLITTLLLFSTLSATAKEVIQIQGSTTVFPIAQEAAKAYMRDNSKVDIAIESSGSGNGIKALIDGTTDIANASRFIKNEEAAMAYEKGAIPIPFRVAYDCIIPVVHRSNPVKEISMERLRAIYSGQIKNWKEIGGDDAPIALFSRDTSSGTFEVWNELVMDKSPVTPAAQLKQSNSEIVKVVQANPDAIGYIGIGYLDATVKPLAVNGVTGSERSAIDGSYPITRPLFMFTRGWPKGEIKKFINFMLEPSQGQKLVKKAGYLSVYLPASSATPCPEPKPSPDHSPCPPCKPCATSEPCPPCGGQKISSTSATSQKVDYDLFLSMGQTEKTILVQKYLNRLGYIVGSIDGIWGPKSFREYTRFQRDQNIAPIYSAIAYPVIEAMVQKIALTKK